MNLNQNSVQYLFGAFQFDPVERNLLKDGQVIPIPQKTLEVLLILIEERGKVIEKEVLMNRLWPDQIVEEGNLTQHIYSLRKALGEDRIESRFIETVPRRGYRFIAEVTELPSQTLVSEIVVEAEAEKFEAGTDVLSTAGTDQYTRASVDKTWTRSAGTRRWGLKEYRKPLFAVLSLFCFLSVLLALSKRQQKRTHGLSEIKKLTYNGTVTTMAIAPDAMSLAYVTLDGDGNQAIWLKRLANRSELQLVPLSKKDYGTLSFSRDGNYLYYVEADNFVVPGTLYRYPLPGGPPTKLLEGKINRVFTLSPDGEYVAYAHRSSVDRLSKLYVARVNGEGEPRVLAAKNMPNFLYAPTWSPDGKMIACVLNVPNEQGDHMTVVGYQVSTGAEKAFTREYWWRITDLTWLGDSRGLAMTAMETIAGQSQIWELSWPSGAATRLTSEFQNYGRISSSADGVHLLSVESKVLSNIWMVETEPAAQTPGATSRPRLEKLLSGDYIGMHGLSVTPDDRVLYTSLEDGNWDLWSMPAGGGRALQLTKNTRTNYMHSASPDGRYIIFSSNRGGRFNIWRMDRDGNNPQQLTNGPGEGYPRYSPDGAWFLYTQGEAPNRTLWRRNVDGGEPLKLADRVMPGPAISPDGNMVAYIAFEGHSGSIEIIPATGGAPLYHFDVDAQSIQWTPDGKAISYVREMKEAANVWNQPLAGGPPKQVTFFDLEYITHFSWFKDGKRLACVRFLPQNDVIQLSLQK